MTYKANYKNILSQLKLKQEQAPDYLKQLITKFDEALAEWDKSDEENKAWFLGVLAQSDVVICAKLVEIANESKQEQQSIKTEIPPKPVTKKTEKRKVQKQEVKQEPEKLNKNKLEELIRKAQELKSKK